MAGSCDVRGSWGRALRVSQPGTHDMRHLPRRCSSCSVQPTHARLHARARAARRQAEAHPVPNLPCRSRPSCPPAAPLSPRRRSCRGSWEPCRTPRSPCSGPLSSLASRCALASKEHVCGTPQGGWRATLLLPLPSPSARPGPHARGPPSPLSLAGLWLHQGE